QELEGDRKLEFDFNREGRNMQYLALLRCLLFIGLILPVMVSGFWSSPLSRGRMRSMRPRPNRRMTGNGNGCRSVQCGGNVTINNTGEITSP
ncbi:unnamed protein product, partial [Porites lobata]